MRVSGRAGVFDEALVPPPDVLRIFALLRVYNNGSNLPQRPRVGSPLRDHERPGVARIDRRRRTARWATGATLLKTIRDPEPADPLQERMDVTFLVLLLLTSLTGLLLLRETAAMGITLVVHLGVVMGLFLTLPYGKFVHGLYRFAALIRFAREERES